MWEFPSGLTVKDPALSLLWYTVDPWPRNFCVLCMDKKLKLILNLDLRPSVHDYMDHHGVLWQKIGNSDVTLTLSPAVVTHLASLSYYFPSFLFFFFCLFSFSKAAPVAYGGSQARGLIGAVSASLRQSHSNTGSEPCLQPTPQLTATPDP